MTITLNIYSHLILEDENKAVNLINNLYKKSRGSVEGLQLPNFASSATNIILQNQENLKRTKIVDIKKSLSNKDLINKWSGKQD